MTLTEELQRYKLAFNIAKTRQDEVVKAVLVVPRQNFYVCDRCGEEKELISFEIYIYTAKNELDLEENRFVVHYCLECLMAIFGTTRDAEEIGYV